MQSVEQMADEIIAREGGYVNDPDDPGGATNHGVTIHTMRRLGLDLNSDGRVTPTDVRMLTREQAREIYVEKYFHAPGISKLPKQLHETVFDMYVNAGGNAVKILQRLLRKMGHHILVDGAIGPQTIKATHAAARSRRAQIADDYGIARRDYYYGLADARPKSRKYARRRDGGKGGWITRAEEYISPKHHLTDDEHRQRVAAWA